MGLPTDAIVPIYYSGSVNMASTNNQSLITQYEYVILQQRQKPTIILEEKNVDVSGIIPGMYEFLVLSERVIRKVIRPISETVTLSESISAGKRFTKSISETIHLSESVLRKVIPKVTETLTLSESIKRKITRPLAETLHLSESDLRKPIPKIVETLTLTEGTIFRKITRKITDSLTLAESVIRKPIPHIAETLSLAENIARKVIRSFKSLVFHIWN